MAIHMILEEVIPPHSHEPPKEELPPKPEPKGSKVQGKVIAAIAIGGIIGWLALTYLDPNSSIWGKIFSGDGAIGNNHTGLPPPYGAPPNYGRRPNYPPEPDWDYAPDPRRYRR